MSEPAARARRRGRGEGVDLQGRGQGPLVRGCLRRLRTSWEDMAAAEDLRLHAGRCRREAEGLQAECDSGTDMIRLDGRARGWWAHGDRRRGAGKLLSP